MNKPAVAILGLGAMGHAFAANLLRKDFRVSGWNRTPARGDDLRELGLIQTETPQQAVAEADVIISMLADGEATQDIINRIAGDCKPSAIFCQMGTIGIEQTEQSIGLLASLRNDIIYLDAPVSGTKTPAEIGQIMVLASGPKEHAAPAEKVFDAISRGTQWFGRAGNSQKMKLVLNAWLIAMMQGIAESAQLAAQFGFSPDILWKTLEGGPLAAPYLKGKLAMIAAADYTPQMQLTHALKDARLALGSAQPNTLPILSEIAKLWEEAVEEGLGQEDLAVVFTQLN